MWRRAPRIALAIALAACTSGTPLPLPERTAEAPATGGRVVIAISQDVGTFTGLLASENLSTELSGLIYRSLIRFDPKTAAPIPGLAESFEQSADGRTLTFRLRQGLRWSDGSALTGEDFRFTVEAILRSKKTVRRSTVQDITGAKDFLEGRSPSVEGISISEGTITVRFQNPFCPALISIGTLGVIPRSVFGKYHDPGDITRNIDAAPENDRPTLASGPFRLADRVKGVSLVVERNDLYHGGRPLLDAIEFRVFAGTPAAGTGGPEQGAVAPIRTSTQMIMEAMLAGNADVAELSALERAERDDLRRAPHLEVRSFVGPRYTYIGWNQLRGGKEFFQSRAVRQALAYGLDVDAVLDKVLAGEAVKVLSHTHPLSWAYDPTGLKEYRYDPRRAVEILEEDGWAKGADGIYQKAGQRLSFTLTVPGNATDFVALQREAVQQYGLIGIEVTPEAVEDVPALIKRIQKRDPVYGAEGGRDLDAWIVRWVLTPDPDAYSIFHSSQTRSGSNFSGNRDPVLDRALEDGRTSCSPAARKAAQRAIDQRLNEEQPYRFALAPKSYLVTSKRVVGPDPSSFHSFSYFWNLEQWWIRP